MAGAVPYKRASPTDRAPSSYNSQIMQRFRRLFSGLLLALLAAVVTWRGFRLAEGSAVLDGRDEKAWFAWAYRDPRIGSVYGSLRPRLQPGERLVLAVPPQQSALWLGIMALYYLPEQKVIGVQGAGEAVPAGTTVLRLSPDGEAVVERPEPR
jgi:hypothetical protein